MSPDEARASAVRRPWPWLVATLPGAFVLVADAAAPRSGGTRQDGGQTVGAELAEVPRG